MHWLTRLADHILTFTLPRKDIGMILPGQQIPIDESSRKRNILLHGYVKRVSTEQRLVVLFHGRTTSHRYLVSSNLRGDINEVIEMTPSAGEISTSVRGTGEICPPYCIRATQITALEAVVRKLYRVHIYRTEVGSKTANTSFSLAKWKKGLNSAYKATSWTRIRRTTGLSFRAYVDKRLDAKCTELLSSLHPAKCQIIIVYSGAAAYPSNYPLDVASEDCAYVTTVAVSNEFPADDRYDVIKQCLDVAESRGVPTYLFCLPTNAIFTKHALEIVARTPYSVAAPPEVIYTDRQRINGEGVQPEFLPQLDPDLLSQIDYISESAFIRIDRKLINELAIHPAKCMEKAFYCHLMRLSLTGAPTFKHVELPLIVVRGSARQRNYWGLKVARQCRNNSLVIATRRSGFSIRTIKSRSNFRATATIIIPTKDRVDLLKQCVASILSASDSCSFEILVVNNRSVEDATLRYLYELSECGTATVIDDDCDFNYSEINNRAAATSKSDILVFLNNDTEIVSPNWLTTIARNAMRTEIGAVGARLLYPSGRIQHAGVVLGIGGVAGHVWRHHLPAQTIEKHRFMNATLTRRMSVVTAACLAIRRSVFVEIGGFDQANLPVAFNDVDLCLRLEEKGYHNLYCADSILIHHESASRGLDVSPQQLRRLRRETQYMQSRWPKLLAPDPHYNSNLTLSFEDFSIEQH